MVTGFYQFPTAKLGLIQDRILENSKRFQQMLDSLALHDLDLDRASSLTRMRKGARPMRATFTPITSN